MKLKFVFSMLLVLCVAQTARAQLSVDLSTVTLSKGDPVGYGSLASPPVYNTTTSTVFRWNGAQWAGMTGVLLTGDIATLQATGTDPTGRACIGIVPVINTTSKQTFGCIDLVMGAVNVSTSSGTGTLTNVTITGTSGQITVTGTCSSATTVSCTISIPAVFLLPGTINKITLTQPATGATITITDGKTLAVLNTLSFSGTDATIINFPNPSSITNGDCVAWGKSGSTLSLTDAGACGGGSGGFVYTGILSGIPATCTIGQTSFITDALAGSNGYSCTASNTWVQDATADAGTGNVLSFDPISGKYIIATDPTLTPRYFVGSGAPAFNCVPGRDSYQNTAAGSLAIYGCGPAVNTWALIGGGTVTDSIQFPAASIQNGAAAITLWDTGVAGGIGTTATGMGGATTNPAVLQFSTAGTAEARFYYKLPHTWTGTISLTFGTESLAGAGVTNTLTVSTVCVSSGGVYLLPTYNTSQTVNIVSNANAAVVTEGTISSLTTTGCGIDKLLIIDVVKSDVNAALNVMYASMLVSHQ